MHTKNKSYTTESANVFHMQCLYNLTNRRIKTMNVILSSNSCQNLRLSCTMRVFSIK